jgi:hypothetical protein
LESAERIALAPEERGADLLDLAEVADSIDIVCFILVFNIRE